MKTKILISAAILIVGTVAAQAQDATAPTQNTNAYSSSSWFNTGSDALYRASEISLDAFGAVTGDWRGHDYFGAHEHHDLQGGGGGGLEYFFCRYIGLEVDSFAAANSDNLTSAVGGNLVLRLPIGETGFAPYIFGGGGSEWTYTTEGYGDGGVGLEYRFTRHFGVFGDGSFVAPATTHNYGMGRLGVRFVF